MTNEQMPEVDARGARRGYYARLATQTFGERFKRWRLDRGVSDETMAKLLGVHPRAIARLDSTTVETAETLQIAQQIRQLQQSRQEPVAPTRQQARALWAL